VAAISETATARPTVLDNFMEGPLLPARGTVTRRNGINHCFNRRGGDRVCSAGPVDLRIGRSRRNWKFRLDMHSMSMGYHCLKALCASAARPSFVQTSRSAPCSGCRAYSPTQRTETLQSEILRLGSVHRLPQLCPLLVDHRVEGPRPTFTSRHASRSRRVAASHSKRKFIAVDRLWPTDRISPKLLGCSPA